MKNHKIYSVGIVGVRGYVGMEFVKLIDLHPNLELSWLSSRKLKDQSINAVSDVELDSNIVIESLTPADIILRGTDIVVLALPNQVAQPFVSALLKSSASQLIIDLSADYRFDSDWIYSVPELHSIKKGKKQLSRPVLLSNPGCYATAMQLAIAPVIDLVLGRPNCFGISGFSGAGTTPGLTNNPENLNSNIIPYKLIEHTHEKEVSFHLKHPISFTPHVADFFRGINMTVQLEFSQTVTEDFLFQRFNDFYAFHEFVHCQKDVPTLQQVVDTHNCVIGGISVSKDGKRATVISCLDNLLKGAASQAIQNINLALGLETTAGLEDSLNPFELKISA